jgi:hypothetical protein
MPKMGVVSLINRLSICALILVFSAGQIFANFETYGARPMGMGGAFTAIADDVNAAYWNPAGLALNPEVSITASTKVNNRNLWVGDNIGNIKLCYETEMNPFLWIAGIGAASLLALQGARYLSNEGILKKGWGREGEKTERGESMAEQVKGSEEVVSLRQEAKEELKTAAKGLLKAGEQVEQAAVSTGKEIIKESVKESVRPYYFAPYSSPWYAPDYYHPHYWEPAKEEHATKAQFALGLSWLNDYNALPAFDQNTNWYTLSLASGFEQRVAIGANLNFYNLQKISTGIKGIGGDLDVGIIAKPVEYISLGIDRKSVV